MARTTTAKATTAQATTPSKAQPKAKAPSKAAATAKALSAQAATIRAAVAAQAAQPTAQPVAPKAPSKPTANAAVAAACDYCAKGTTTPPVWGEHTVATVLAQAPERLDRLAAAVAKLPAPVAPDHKYMVAARKWSAVLAAAQAWTAHTAHTAPQAAAPQPKAASKPAQPKATPPAPTAQPKAAKAPGGDLRAMLAAAKAQAGPTCWIVRRCKGTGTAIGLLTDHTVVCVTHGQRLATPSKGQACLEARVPQTWCPACKALGSPLSPAQARNLAAARLLCAKAVAPAPQAPPAKAARKAKATAAAATTAPQAAAKAPRKARKAQAA